MPHRPKSASRIARLRLMSITPITIIIVATVTITAIAVSARGWRAKTSNATTSRVTRLQVTPTPNGQGYVRRVRLFPELQRLFAPLGNRLTTPGLERLTLIGTLSRPGASKVNLPSRLILEFPANLRLEEQDGPRLNVLLFNGQDIKRPGDTVKPSDQDDVESLVFDGVDHFFLSQMQGQATRFIGSRYRLDDGSTKNYTGPFYDVYEVSDQIVTGNHSREQLKLYYFNSDTLALEKVRYQTSRSGPRVNAEVQFSGWLRVNGQFLPTRITEVENGVTMLDFRITSAAISARVNDGIFDR